MSRSQSNPKRNASSQPKGGAANGKGKAASRRTPEQRRAELMNGQVGRRPSRPGVLGLIGIAWIVVGIIELVALQATWRFAVGIVFIGIGVFFLRGAFVSVLRHDRRDQS